MLERVPQSKSPSETPPTSGMAIEEAEEARAYVDLLIKRGIKPIVTVPAEHVEEFMKYGVRVLPKYDRLSGAQFSFVAGTIGLEPYLPENEERYVFEVDPTKVKIEPRFTGKDRAFHGVVGFVEGIPNDAFRSLGQHSSSSWENRKPLH